MTRRSADLRLFDIVEAIEHIRRKLEGISLDEFRRVHGAGRTPGDYPPGPCRVRAAACYSERCCGIPASSARTSVSR